MKVFGEYAQYYELLYRDKDYKGEAEFVKSLLEKHSLGRDSILELGCGAGKHAVLLAEMGYQIHGVDFSRGMLDLAEKRTSGLASDIAERLSWSKDDVRSFITDRRFDAVISLFHVVSYQPANSDLKAIFRTAATHLKPEGIFLFDCWYGPTVLNEPPKVRIKRMENENILITRICEPEMLPRENGVIINYTVFIENKASGRIAQIQESHRMRYLFTPEVESLYEESGMQMIESGEWMTNQDTALDTFSVYFAGKKKV